MDRAAIEAHLTLHDWEPVRTGAGGAAQGDRMVYAAADWSTDYPMSHAIMEWNVQRSWLAVHRAKDWSEIGDRELELVARRIDQLAQCKHDGLPQGGSTRMVRCTSCGQKVEV